MTSYRIALNFEDGVTRFIDCGATEKVLDSAFRQRINLPMDCSDGVWHLQVPCGKREL